jgi:hypothetical protein
MPDELGIWINKGHKRDTPLLPFVSDISYFRRQYKIGVKFEGTGRG